MIKRNSNLEKENGITLIALVVTIIVLIILAGISINLVLGENGIITKAKMAKLETRAATVEEIVEMWKAEKVIASEGTNQANIKTLEELLEDLENKQLITEKEKQDIKETGSVQIGKKEIDFSESKGFECESYTLLQPVISMEDKLSLEIDLTEIEEKVLQTRILELKRKMSDEELYMKINFNESEQFKTFEELIDYLYEGGEITVKYKTLQELYLAEFITEGTEEEKMQEYQEILNEIWTSYVTEELDLSGSGDNIQIINPDGTIYNKSYEIPCEMREYIFVAKIKEQEFKFKIKIEQYETVKTYQSGFGNNGTWKVDLVNKTYEKISGE